MPSFAPLIVAINLVPAHHAAIVSATREHLRCTSPFPMLSQPKLAASLPAPSASTASSWTPPYPPSSPSSRLSALPASCRRRRTSCHLESLRRPSTTLPSPTSSRTAPRQAPSPTNVRPASISFHLFPSSPAQPISPQIHPDPQMHEPAVERTCVLSSAAPQPPSPRSILSSLSTHPSHLRHIHLVSSSLIPSHLISPRLPPSLYLPSHQPSSPPQSSTRTMASSSGQRSKSRPSTLTSAPLALLCARAAHRPDGRDARRLQLQLAQVIFSAAVLALSSGSTGLLALLGARAAHRPDWRDARRCLQPQLDHHLSRCSRSAWASQAA